MESIKNFPINGGVLDSIAGERENKHTADGVAA